MEQVSEGVVLLAKYFRRLAEANETESNAGALSRAIQAWLSYEFEQSRFSVDISKDHGHLCQATDAVN